MMKTTTAALLTIVLAFPAVAQRPRPPRPAMMANRADTVEAALKQAAEDLANLKKQIDIDLQVLVHIRAADDALVDAMQPTVAIEKAHDEISQAQTLEASKRFFDPDFTVKNGLVKCMTEVERARLSPTTADFGHLRTVVREEGVGPASRRLVREATALSTQTAAWIRIQQQISDHLRVLGDIVAECLKASDQ